MLYLIINSSIEKKEKLEFFQKIVSHTHGPRPSEKTRKTKRKRDVIVRRHARLFYRFKIR